MAYTLSQFITQAQGGGAVKITNVTPNTNVVLKIGSRAVELAEKAMTWNVVAGVKTMVETDTRVLDLGTLFSANQVLESDTLRKALSDGTIIAEAGTVALSLVPTSV